MHLSARNVIAGRITAVRLGSVEAEVSLELSPGVVVTSVITRASAERLGLHVGDWSRRTCPAAHSVRAYCCG